MQNRTWLVLKHDFLYTVTKPSFIIILILLPLMPLFLYFLMTLASPEEISTSPEGQIAQKILEPDDQARIDVEGLVDESGMLGSIPPLLEGNVRFYLNREQAYLALEHGEINSLYVFPRDYMENGKVTVVRRDFNPLSGALESRWLDYYVAYNLLKKDELLVERFAFPLENLEVSYVNHKKYHDMNDIFGFLVPYVLALFFFTSLYGSASLMLGGLERERQNRVIEVLITSVTTRQFITGKIIGLGFVGLFQIVVWLGIIGGLNWLNGGFFHFLSEFHFSISVILWSVALFIPGYAIYASFMAGVGALVPNMKEATQIAVLVMVPLILPLVFLLVMLRNPDGVLSTGLSLFPLTSPIGMAMRMTMTDVPVWQAILALVLLWATAIFVIRLVAGLFRAQYLLSNQPFSWELMIRALRGRA